MEDKGDDLRDMERTKQPVEEEEPTPADVDMDPEDHVNRPDQPDFDPEEREQYETPIAEPVIPQDR